MQTLLSVASITLYTFVGLLGLVFCLHMVGKFGPPGRALSRFLCRAPALDVVVATLTWVPWVVGWCVAKWHAEVAGWWGVLAAVAGELAALAVWVVTHEWLHREQVAGPRIIKALNRTVGRFRNHLALWVTAIALPIFWFIRAGEVFVYPFLVLILNFPKYKQGDWVNCSRQKFDGLVGHDLIWCLYCDWMTGVYSLGGEMLRNVESFWCPIRFYEGKKCENCRVDFPDIDGGWVGADKTMKEVEAKVDEMYGSGRREWFGHPARKSAAPAPVAVTIGGQPAGTAAAAVSSVSAAASPPASGPASGPPTGSGESSSGPTPPM